MASPKDLGVGLLSLQLMGLQHAEGGLSNPKDLQKSNLISKTLSCWVFCSSFTEIYMVELILFCFGAFSKNINMQHEAIFQYSCVYY